MLTVERIGVARVRVEVSSVGIIEFVPTKKGTLSWCLKELIHPAIDFSATEIVLAQDAAEAELRNEWCDAAQ